MTTFLRQRRSSMRLSQAQLAEYLDVSQQTVARWESSGQIPAKYIKDLAIVLGARAQDFLPRLSESPSKSSSSNVLPLRPPDNEACTSEEEESKIPFGDVCFHFSGDPEGEATFFPVTWGTLNLIQQQLGDAAFDPPQTAPWIQFEALNNKWVTVNTQQVDRISFVDDNVEAMSHYQHDEVYKAAADLLDNMPIAEELEKEEFPYSKSLVEKATAFIEATAEQAYIELYGLTVQFASGHQMSQLLNSEVATLLDLMFSGTGRFEPQARGFLQLNFRDDGQFEHVRLDGVRLIEAALLRFLEACDED